MTKKVEVNSVAEAYIELLAARGIDYFFGNGGTDFGPIVEAYANRFAKEEMLPKPIPVPHEITAVAMSHGYTMVTGKPQVVMVHTLPGTANAVGGILNASRSNVPILFTAGRTPITEGERKATTLSTRPRSNKDPINSDPPSTRTEVIISLPKYLSKPTRSTFVSTSDGNDKTFAPL